MQLSFKTFLVLHSARLCSSTKPPSIPKDLVFSAPLRQHNTTPFPTPPPLPLRNNNGVTCETSGTTSHASSRGFAPRLSHFDIV